MLGDINKGQQDKPLSTSISNVIAGMVSGVDSILDKTNVFIFVCVLVLILGYYIGSR